MAQHVADSEEARLVVFDHTAVGRYVYLAVRECVESVNGLVRGYARSEMHLDFHFCSRVVVHLLCLYLSLVDGFQYGVDKRGGGL